MSESEKQKKKSPQDRASERRAKRIAGRSSTLRRKTVGGPTNASPEAASQEKKEESKKPVRVTKAKKPASKRTRAPARSATEEKPIAKKKTTAASKAKGRTKKTNDEEGYELRSLPDGTLFRVKITEDKKTVSKTPTRRGRKSRDSGPGPAIVDLMYDNDLLKTALPEKVRLTSIIQMTKRSVAYLKRRTSLRPKMAIILGPGLSSVGEIVGDNSPIEMGDVPGFVSSTAPYQAGLIKTGMVEGVATLFCEERVHFYETGSMADAVYPVQAFIALGVKRLILITPASSVNPDFVVGDIMFVSDQINLMGDNPLIGVDPKSDPSVFVDPSDLYSKQALSVAERLCRRARVPHKNGVLAGVIGPLFETNAESRMLRTLGADAVSNGVIPEAIVAKQANIPVTALAVITRQREGGVSGQTPATMSEVRASTTGLKRLVTSLIGQEW